ncbi:uncharacterized protein B0H64DRAFT_65540 [Chaetomium fimeti]|uniref:Uncharacterized protein n=1 Tax=Chaetomium fimeti TaxID=1854472 RepID=A0AAE0LUM2_9PEZI|nr:hypothetical protein B0H64DRAFT_65540 [Chaetomium fimeti]
MAGNSNRSYTTHGGSSNPMAPESGAASRPPVVPTPETQDLYNKWRQAYEETLNEESLRNVQNLHGAHLQLPSSSQTTTSRSPSNASTTYSVSQAMDGMNVGDLPQKQKPGRRGPLTGVQQLRANLMRKLGACADCRARRVPCKNHHNFALFEEGYQAAKQETRSLVDTAQHVETTTPYQARLGNPSDLAGVGGGQSALAHGPQGAVDDGYPTDFDPLQDTEPGSRPDLDPILALLQDAQLPVSNPADQYRPIPQVTQQPELVAIGKQVAPYSKEWTCFGGITSWNTSPSNGALEPCREKLPGLPALNLHFATSHQPGVYGQSYTWACVTCQVQVLEIGGLRWCAACQQITDWEMWYWGQVPMTEPP